MIESIDNLEDTRGLSVKEWVIQLAPRTEIENRFKNFLRNFINSKSQFIYKEKIRRMCENNHSSFEVEFTHLAVYEQTLAYFLPEAPLQMLEIFDKVAKELVLAIYPMYERVTSNIHVRISELPLTEDIRVFRFVDILLRSCLTKSFNQSWKSKTMEWFFIFSSIIR